MTHSPSTTPSTSEETTILGEGKREIPADIRRAAREFLAVEYDSSAGEGPYPTYADLARNGQGSFTMCSIRAIEKAILAERRRWTSIVEERDLLREAVVRYCDHSRMGTVEPMSVQQAIDDAFTHYTPLSDEAKSRRSTALDEIGALDGELLK